MRARNSSATETITLREFSRAQQWHDRCLACHLALVAARPTLMHDLMPFEPYHVAPDDPRSPPQEIWDALSPEERQRIVDSLPSEFPVSEANPPEGVFHFEASRAELVQQLAEESRLRAEETQRREDAERQLAEARAEIARLRGERA
ncbi:hypothetical protein BHS09_34750 [Myxococcus xanthus]|uniref:Uncharacterized protein n=2 Tax=Myxococcus xanthus TaxID=34 RepID=A0AAE6KVW4_MYXXA|nr:hypothetical protein BHS09_34750 [Myxococcus xanthus]QDE79017.1 hypothetical protein BHS08_34775 [Myxococcus xanthus]